MGSGYMLWFKGARSTIKGKNIAEVSKKAGEMWKGLSAEKKKPFADKAQEAKKTYDAYVATSKGAAALKAYKDAIATARAPLTKNSDAVKAKKAAAKVKAKAKREKAKAKAAAKKRKGAGFEGKGKSQGSSGKREVQSHEGSKGRKSKSQGGSKGKSQGGEKSKGESQGKSQGGEKRESES